MKTQRIIWVLVALISVAEAKRISAQQPLPGTQELLQRLEEAEEHINRLHSELTEVRSQAGTASLSGSAIQQVAAESADEKKNDKKIESLEKEVDGIMGYIDKGTNWVYSGHSGSTMKVVGRVHVDYWGFPDDSRGVNAFEDGNPNTTPQDRLGFRRIRFGVRGDIKDNMEYRIEMEFAGGNESEFRDVWLGFKNLPFLQKVLVGNQKRPYGLDHLNSSRYNVFIERPFVIEAINQDARRVGIASHGVSEDLKYNWRYGVYNQRLIQDEGNHINDQLQLEVAGRFANTIWYDETSGGRGYAHWAVSGTIADPDGNAPNNGREDNEARFRHRPEARSVSRWLDTGRIAGANSYQLLGTEAVVNVGPFQAVGEYMNLWLQRNGNFGEDVQFHGGYAYASYFLTGEHIPWNRKSGTLGRVKPFQNFFMVKTCDGGIDSGWGAWQVAVRYSHADFTDQNITGGVGNSITYAVNWHWNQYASMQFNYIDGRISQRGPVAGETSGNYEIAGVRMRVDF